MNLQSTMKNISHSVFSFFSFRLSPPLTRLQEKSNNSYNQTGPFGYMKMIMSIMIHLCSKIESIC